MGHYLSDFETDDEHRRRTVDAPMLDRLRTYDDEVRRGLVHTTEYDQRMREARDALRERGYAV